MADIEFTCSACSTPLVVAVEGTGKVVTCPNCSARVVVPGPRRIEVASLPPPIAPGRTQDCRDYDLGITLRTRNCTLAYVSLALVCLSFLTAMLLLLPGIVCAHIAVAQCNRDPGMIGKSYAVAALVIGYVIIGVALVILLGFVGLISATH